MNVLIVDDDRNFRDAYELMLDGEGYDVRGVADQRELLAALRDTSWDVVVLDQNLRGAAGGPVGLELVDTIRSYSPGACVVVVTGYADEKQIKRGFRVGVDDYLVKNQLLDELLRAKLRVIYRMLSQCRFAQLSRSEIKQRVQESWRALQDEAGRRTKGRLLEVLVVGMFQLLDGVERTIPQLRNELEELDVAVIVDSQGPLAGVVAGRYVLVECKNWTKPVPRAEYDALVGKMRRRKGRCSVALFIVWNGPSKPFREAAARDQEFTVAVVDRSDLAEFVAAAEPMSVFKAWIDRAVLGADGSR